MEYFLTKTITIYGYTTQTALLDERSLAIAHMESRISRYRS